MIDCKFRIKIYIYIYKLKVYKNYAVYKILNYKIMKKNNEG